ncbi:MAG: damage-inducible protein DinB [Gemmatimonadaceae bacterium]|nr:damage-inducible protein DinB [Gemmatimonadaceae bacterium]
MSTAAATAAPTFITPDALLQHRQGHRRLTRRMIAAFPEDKLFTFSVGGMRSFGELASEMVGMAVPTVRGMVTNEWDEFAMGKATSLSELLRQWDQSTMELDALWPKIPAERFAETLTAFGQYTMPGYALVLYCVDNEIHHRGQGYVYLRALGIEPPPFWER